MRPSRRTFLQRAGGAAALGGLARAANAQPYPARPVRIVVGFSPGITPDITARLMGQWLSERLGQPFIVENRPGAGSNIATEAVARAAPDGYTLLLVTLANAVNATLYGNLSFDFIRDIAPVASILHVPLVMEVHPSVPATTVAEFIAYARSHPGRINMASGGDGSPQHVAGELFRMMTGIDMPHVAYRGNPLPDLIAGEVQVYFGPLPGSIGYIRAGKLRALAVTSTTRSAALPDLPIVGDFVPGYEASSWYGIGAPRGTPESLVEKLNREVNAALADPGVRGRLAELGAEPLPMKPAAFGQLIAEETGKWGRVVRFVSIRLD